MALTTFVSASILGCADFEILVRKLQHRCRRQTRTSATHGMTTIPSRLATVTRASFNAEDARHRTLKLYRDWYRSVCDVYTRISPEARRFSQAPEIVSLYALNVSPAYIRHCIRQQFERNRYVTDPRAIDVLLLKNRQEYQETMNCWKQLDHIMGIMLKPQERTPRTFLQKFYEGWFNVYYLNLMIHISFAGRDEDTVLSQASGV